MDVYVGPLQHATVSMRMMTLTIRQQLDLEQILDGGFAPLSGFLTFTEYRSVVEDMRLPSGALWPMPIVLDVPDYDAARIGEKIMLCDEHGRTIALLTVQSIYAPDKTREALRVYGTDDGTHPGVRYLMHNTGAVYLGGPVERVARMPAPDFPELRYSPAELKLEFKKRGWDAVVAFQTRNPIHRAHYEVITRAARSVGGKLLIHPVAGLTKEGDFDYLSRTRGYKHIQETYLKDEALLALLPIAMRMAGPREALWHALIRKNYGATHFIVGRDHAGPGNDSWGNPFYGRYAAQRLLQSLEQELDIGIISVPEIAYVENENRYLSADELQPHHVVKSISGTEFRRMLRSGETIPEWFSFPEVVAELRDAIEKEQSGFRSMPSTISESFR